MRSRSLLAPVLAALTVLAACSGDGGAAEPAPASAPPSLPDGLFTVTQPPLSITIDDALALVEAMVDLAGLGDVVDGEALPCLAGTFRALADGEEAIAALGAVSLVDMSAGVLDGFADATSACEGATLLLELQAYLGGERASPDPGCTAVAVAASARPGELLLVVAGVADDPDAPDDLVAVLEAALGSAEEMCSGVGAVVAPVAIPFELGDDAELDLLAVECAGGALRACDELYASAPPDTVFASFGGRCGNRLPEVQAAVSCSSALGAGDPRADAEHFYDDGGTAVPFGIGGDEALDVLADDCAAGFLDECYELYLDAPADGDYEQFGATCGDRLFEPVLDRPCWELLFGP